MSELRIPKNINFLIIDDMTFTHSFILQSLKKLGFEGNVFSAKSVKHAIEKINGAYKNGMTIDFIITDLHLPDGNGIDVVKKVRATKKMANTPILMMTTDENSHFVVEAFEAGVDNYFFKPIEDEIMLQKINFAWNKHASKKAS